MITRPLSSVAAAGAARAFALIVFSYCWCCCCCWPSIEAASELHDNAPPVVVEDYILGGHPARFGEIPWQVAIEVMLNDTWMLNCGGVLFEPTGRWVLTSARCTDVQLEGRVVSGMLDIQHYYTAQFSPIDTYYTHDEYAPPPVRKNNIALIKLSKPVRFSKHVGMLPLFDGNVEIDRSNCLVAGWGEFDSNSNFPDLLQKLYVPLIPRRHCQTQYSSHYVANNLCAGIIDQKGFGTCDADNGGPLVCFHRRAVSGEGDNCTATDPKRHPMVTMVPYVVGILNYGLKPCGQSATMYTPVKPYLEWINRILNKKT